MDARTLLSILAALCLPAAFAQEKSQSAGSTIPGFPPAPFVGVRVTAGPRNAVFKFLGAANAAPRVMIVNGPLKQLPNGSLMFDGPPLHLKATRNSGVSSAGFVEFIASSDLHRDPQASDQWLTLVPGAHYYYFIFEKGSAHTQEGAFTTPAEATPQLERPDPPANKPAPALRKSPGN